MSVYKPANSPFYHFDFQMRKHRFHGTTKCTENREAKSFERAQKEQARKQLTQANTTAVSLKLDDLVGRYWTEVGQHHVNSEDTWRDLCRLVDYFGKDSLITDVTDNDVAKLVVWRRNHRIIRKQGKKPEECRLVTNATVNRTTILVLKSLFSRAATWGVKFEHIPKWKEHLLSEPRERVRELRGEEGPQLEAATRADYRPFFEFARATVCVVLTLAQRPSLWRPATRASNRICPSDQTISTLTGRRDSSLDGRQPSLCPPYFAPSLIVHRLDFRVGQTEPMQGGMP